MGANRRTLRFPSLSLALIVICATAPFAAPAVRPALAAPAFGTQRGFGLSSDNTNDIALGDVDGDGSLDIAVARAIPSESAVYLNDGAGNFAFGTTVDCEQNAALLCFAESSAGGAHTAVALGDLNGDGRLDLVAGRAGGQSSVYLQQASAPQQWRELAIGPTGVTVKSIALGDLDSNGTLDIAIGYKGRPTDVFKNNGQPTPSFTAVGVGGPTDPAGVALAICRLGGASDGEPDLAIAAPGGGSQVFVNTTIFGISVLVPGPTFGASYSLACGDLNGDGAFDLVGNGTLALNDGAGGLTASAGPALGGDIALAYLDSDETLDLYSSGGSIVLNDGFAAFSDGFTTDPGDVVAAGDLSGDGLIDLVHTTKPRGVFGVGTLPGRNSITINSGAGAFKYWRGLAEDYQASNSFTTMTMADMNNDGRLDIVKSSIIDVGYAVLLNSGDQGSFSFRPGPYSISGIRDLAIGDVSGDGILDIVIAGSTSLVLIGDGSGGMTSEIELGDFASDASIGDVNDDGALDILLARGISPSLELFLNDRRGGFTLTELPSIRISGIDVATLEDIDRDNDLDILAGRAGARGLIMRNDGEARFEFAGEFGQPQAPLTIRTADMNGDEAPDIIIGDGLLPVTIYFNDGSGGFPAGDSLCDSSPAVVCLGNNLDFFHQLALGDIEQDGDLDLIDGAGQLHLNDGTGRFTAGAALRFDGIGGSVAIGDVTGDGAPEIVRATFNGPTILFTNPAAHTLGSNAAPRLPNTPPAVDVRQPAGLLRGPRFAQTTLLTTPQITIPFTLADKESDPVRFVRAFYSLDGGGKWRPANTAGGVNERRNLTTSPAGTPYNFVWDLGASAFFGQSDNVLFRIEAYPSLISRTDSVPLFQRPFVVGTGTPFRARGTQIKVVDTTGRPRSGALVFRLNELLTPEQQLFAPSTSAPGYTTGRSGALPGRGTLALSDTLIALAPVPLPGPYAAVYSPTVRLYATNIITTPAGVAGFVVRQSGVQTVTVSLERPLALFDLIVSLEWDARYDERFMSQLRADLARTSELLFQGTHGQAALGAVAIFHDRENWDYADIRIYASNRVRPSALIGGVAALEVSDPADPDIIYSPGQVQMGATWNRFGASGGSLSEDWPRTLAHELGHYLFFLEDNYLGRASSGVVMPVTSCPGIMSDPYTSEWQFQTRAGWSPGCEQTFSNQASGRADWETIATFYEALRPPTLAVSALSSGPIRQPLALTEIREVPPLTPTLRLDVPIFYTVNEQGERVIPALTARAFLFQRSHGEPSAAYTQLTPLGRANSDQVLARGARVGDKLCLFEPIAARFGCETIRQGDEQLTLHSLPAWQPDIRITPVTSTTLELVVTSLPPGSSGLSASLYPLDDDPLPTPVTIRQTRDGSYRGTIQLAYPLPGAFIHLQTVSQTPNGSATWETVTSYALGGNAGAFIRSGGGAFIRSGGGAFIRSGGGAFIRSGGGAFIRSGGGAFIRSGGGAFIRGGGGAPVSSAEGDVMLTGENLDFALGQFVLLQTLSTLPAQSPLPPWATQIGQGYRFTTSQSAPSFSGTTLTFSYLDSEVPAGEEGGIEVYYRSPTDQAWSVIPAQPNTTFNLISIPNQGPGLYALMSSVQIPLPTVGWNNFAYPVAVTREVGLALSSIAGDYSIVYSHVPDDTLNPWKVYAPAPAPTWASDLKDLSFGRGYWIYTTRATDLFLRSTPLAVTSSASLSDLSLPPALVYGVPKASTGAPLPAPGQVVTASIGSAICGQGIVREMGEELVFTVKVAALGPEAPNCGSPERFVTIQVNGRTIGIVRWDNTHATNVYGGEQTVYLPLLRS